MKKAVYAGSFDPFTNGHLSIVEDASLLFDELIICIANNKNKKRLIDANEMKKAIEKVIKRLGLKNVQVSICDSLVADFCKENEAQYIVRGLRNTSDYMYEENIAKINREINPNLTTVYFYAKNDTISSSMVRELNYYHKSIDKYIPQEIKALLSQ